MRLYEKPNMDILNILAEDIVTASGLWVDPEGAGDNITGDEVFGPLK